MSSLAQFGSYATILTTSLPFLMIATVFIVMARNVARQQRAARDWPTAPGQVLLSETQARTHKVGNTGGTATSHYAVVLYRYRVGGADYQSQRISPGEELGYGSRQRAQARIARYPQGAQVTVHYNPLDPNEAVLEFGSPRMTVLFWIGLAMVALLALSTAFSWGIVRFTQAIIGSLPH